MFFYFDLAWRTAGDDRLTGALSILVGLSQHRIFLASGGDRVRLLPAGYSLCFLVAREH